MEQEYIRKNTKKKVLVVLGILIMVLVLAFAYWTISPLFRTVVVNDALPTLSPTEKAKPIQPINNGTRVIEENGVQTANFEVVSEKQNDDTKTTQTATKPVTKPVTAPGASGPFEVVATKGHPSSGSVRVIKTESKTIVRYEDFKTINGPDLRLYLASDKKATKFIDLGDIKGTEGNINYTVPDDVDLEEYPYVLTWCRAFGVLFNSVNLSG